MSMTGQPKALASLSSTLLARKGHARPAMRPQGFGGFGSLPGAQDDLGWNDMGEAPEMTLAEAVPGPTPQPVPSVLIEREALKEEFEAPVLSELPAVASAPVEAEVAAPEPEPEPEPASESAPIAPAVQVHATKRAESVAATAAIADRAPPPVFGQARGARVAFTLRLDHDRHLRLRLASALRNRSAQHLLTEALDAFLAKLPELETLARQRPGADPMGDVR